MVGNRGTRWHDEAEENLVRDGVAVGAALLAGWMALTIVGCAVSGVADESRSAQAGDTYHSPTLDLLVRDVDEPQGAVRIVQEMEARQEAEEAAAEEEEEEAPEEEWYDDYYEDYYEESYAPSYSGDGFQQQGVRDGVDSETETWYSSQARRHEDTAQWSVDDEGYYRTDEGYYVIASDDYEKGTVINTSKGEAQVLDDGTDSGNADFYVAW